MIAEILSTGDEIRSGAVRDTNASHIAQKLESIGVGVVRHNCVGDDESRIAEILKEIGQRADFAVVTGGLGPTEDDLAAVAAADATGVGMFDDKVALERIEAFFHSRGLKMPPSNAKQARFPQGANVLYNPVGTAPGFCMRIGRCRFYFLPGVPHEMKNILENQVLPDIEKHAGDDRDLFRLRSICVFGLGESTVNEKIAGLTDEFPDIRLGLRARFPEIQIKLQVQGRQEDRLDALLQEGTRWVEKRLGDKIFSTRGESMEEVVGRLLSEREATVALAESCTGGLIAHMLTSVSGSSDYFLLSAVTYSNNAKVKVLGVNTGTLEKHGAVHEETAREMAQGTAKVAGATYGLSTTGIAGPTGGSDEKPVGTVCIGLATPQNAVGKRFVFSGFDRSSNKMIFAMTALNELRMELAFGLQPS